MSYRSSLFVCLPILLASLVGCSQPETETGASSNEIERFIQENPDLVARPEDTPASEADEFAAGNESAAN